MYRSLQVGALALDPAPDPLPPPDVPASSGAGAGELPDPPASSSPLPAVALVPPPPAFPLLPALPLLPPRPAFALPPALLPVLAGVGGAPLVGCDPEPLEGGGSLEVVPPCGPPTGYPSLPHAQTNADNPIARTKPKRVKLMTPSKTPQQ